MNRCLQILLLTFISSGIVIPQFNSQMHRIFKDGPTWNYDQLASVVYLPSRITTKGEDTQRFTFSYDSSGNLTSKIRESLRDTAWVYTTRWTFNWDTSKVLTVLFEDWVDERWVLYSKQTDTYDIKGNLLSSYWQNWKYDRWLFTEKYTYSYNTVGQITEIMRTDWENGSWVDKESRLFTYDDRGNPLTMIYKNWIKGILKQSWKSSFIYDSNDKLISRVDGSIDGEKWKPYSTYTYSYNEKGNKLNQMLELYKKDIWVKSLFSAFTYDSTGKILSEEKAEWKDSTWEKSSRHTFTYNNGLLKEELREIWVRWTFKKLSEKRWDQINKNVYSYDEHGNAIHEESFYWKEVKWIPSKGLWTMYYNKENSFVSFMASVADIEYIQSVYPKAIEKREALKENILSW